jgi:hypothetical protein
MAYGVSRLIGYGIAPSFGAIVHLPTILLCEQSSDYTLTSIPVSMAGMPKPLRHFHSVKGDTTLGNIDPAECAPRLY